MKPPGIKHVEKQIKLFEEDLTLKKKNPLCFNYRFVASRPVNFVLSSFVSSVIYCEPLREKAVDISFVRKNVTRDRVVQLVVAHNLITTEQLQA